MIGVSLPPVLRLKDVPPLRVFRRELLPLPASAWMVYGIAGAALVAVLLVLFDNIGSVLVILAAAALAVGMLGLVIFLILKGARRSLSAAAVKRGLWMRSLRNLVGHTGTTTGQLLAFGLTAMVMVILLLLRTDLVDQWQAQLPSDAPNKFVFNIQPFEKGSLSAALGGRRHRHKNSTPLLRGRLLWNDAKNNNSGDGERSGPPRRELNLPGWISCQKQQGG